MRRRKWIIALAVVVLFTVGPIIGLIGTENKFCLNYYLGWYYVIGMWSGFGFGCACDNMSIRKGYNGKFLWGFFFGFFGFLYWALIPPAWDHPEYAPERLEGGRSGRGMKSANRSCYRATVSQPEPPRYSDPVRR